MKDNFDTELEWEKLAFEKDKHFYDVELRHRELDIKENEHNVSQFRNPLVLAVIAASLGLLGNAIVAFINGSSERTLERDKASATLDLEERKAEAGRILEALKTGDPDKAAANLELLVETNLVKTEAASISKYLENRSPGKGASLPAATSTATNTASSIVLPSIIELIKPDWNKVLLARKNVIDMSNEDWSRLNAGFGIMKQLPSTEVNSLNVAAEIYKQYFFTSDRRFFLPWNRVFLLYIENSLQNIDPDIVLPYWDLEGDIVIPEQFIEREASNTTNYLWSLHRSIEKNLFEIEKVELFSSEMEFRKFSQMLENSHNRLHVMIGGKMATADSTYDALSILVKTSVDHSWFEWQKMNGDSELSDWVTRLDPFNLNVRQTLLGE